MIPSITRQPVYDPYIIGNPSRISLPRDFESLSFSDKLKSIGLIDAHFNVQFTPKEIPEISKKGKARFDHLMKRAVHCYSHDGEIIVSKNHAEYISGFKSVLSEKGIEIQSYLRGGYAAYVADLGEYFEFLIHGYLSSKNLPCDLLDKEIEAFKNLKEVAPHDVDLFDQVLTNGIPSTALCNYHIEFLGQKKKIKFLQLLLPGDVTPLYPYPADYVLFTLGNESFQTDRIIGRLHHKYLHARDDIRIEIKNNQMCIPESAGNFWQMVIDRKLKIVRTEDWHEKDFRAGLAALQLIQNGHILIEDHCPLQSILHYALSTRDEKIFTGAINRAKLHCQDPIGFLLSVLIAYSHTALITEEHLKILMDEIGEIPPLPSLYKYALLLTLYKDKTCSAEWDPSGFIILYWNKHRIVFPKDFSLTSTEKPFFSSHIGSWFKCASGNFKQVYKVLDGELSHLERVLFEITLQKAFTPLSDELKEALVEYLINNDSVQERVAIAKLLPFEFSACSENMDWMKTLLKYSFKHGLRLWNAFKNKMDEKTRCAVFEQIILHIMNERPIQSYILLDEESIPRESRLRILKKMAENTALPPQTSKQIVDELIEAKSLNNVEPFLVRMIETLPLTEGYELWKKLESLITLSPKLLLTIDRLISSSGELLPEDEEWFFNSNPSRERIEALSHNTRLLTKWIDWKHDSLTFQNHKNTFKALPETYIKYIKQFQLELLAREWIESFPPPERMAQTLLFFSDFIPPHYPLLETVCALPGLNEKKLMEALHTQGLPVFADRSTHKLLQFLNLDFSLTTKKEILKAVAKMSFNDKDAGALQRWMKSNPSLSLDLAAYMLEKEDHLSLCRNHLIFLKTTKSPSSNSKEFAPLWIKVLNKKFIACELIPFFQNREWVRSVYGGDSAIITQEWAEALIIRGNLKKVELTAVEDMLTRGKLLHTPLAELKAFLESIYNEKITDDMVESYLKGMINTLLFSVSLEKEHSPHCLHLLFSLFKLGLKSKLHKNNEFTRLKEVLVHIPRFSYLEYTFDPLFHLMQTLPLIDHGSIEIYHEFNSKRDELLGQWAEIPDSETFSKKESKLRIMPYEDVKLVCEYALQFKIITGQYIEEKMTKEEFQIEIREFLKSDAHKFETQEFLPHEDPRLICIHDLLFLLKNTNKRARAYEAFYYLLQNRADSSLHDYLKIRQKTEELFLARMKLLDTNQILYVQFMSTFFNHVSTLALLNLHIQDPILDAMELESISLINKIELKRFYRSILSDIAFFQINRIESYEKFESEKLNEKDVENILRSKVISLQKTRKSLSQEMITKEIEWITSCTIRRLSTDKIKKMIKYIETTLNTNLPYSISTK